MSQTYRALKGMFDILPAAGTSGGESIPGSSAWQHVEATVRGVMARYNVQEIRTPIMEATDLIARGIGQFTDIVSKEMFAFARGKEHYVLRPEITAPVMRAYLEHNLAQQGGVQKLFYIGPCFRAERPQKGRYRQFHQFGVEVIGTDDARADVEVITMMVAVYKAFGIDETVLRLNTLGEPEDRERYKAALQDYFAPYTNDLSETSQQRLQRNPLRILDTKAEQERKLLDEAPVLVDYVGSESLAHFDETKLLLSDLGIPYVEDPFLVRGLDYYTRTAFELQSDNLGAQSALAGGGRYDLLSQEIGSKKPVPAVGFAAGIERLFIALSAQGIELPATPRPHVFIVALGDEARRWAVGAAQQLRDAGLRVATDLKGRSMKAQMREANRQDAPYALIVGKDELVAQEVQAKDMQASEQHTVAMGDLLAFLQDRV